VARVDDERGEVLDGKCAGPGEPERKREVSGHGMARDQSFLPIHAKTLRQLTEFNKPV